MRQLTIILRQLARTPMFTIAALLCLGLGTGANVAVFSIASAVLSRPLQYEKADEIVLLSLIVNGNGNPLNFVQVDELRQAAKGIDLAARTYTPVSFNDGTQAYMVEAELVTANYISQVLRPRLSLGRRFVDADDGPTTVAPVIISQGLWQRRFNSDPDVIGKAIRINARDAVIIGVTPEKFNGVMSIVQTDAWFPMTLRETLVPTSNTAPLFGLTGRLNPGVTAEQVEAQLQGLLPFLRTFPQSGRDIHFEVRTAAGVGVPPGVRGQVLYGLSFLGGLALLVLSITVSNVVSLLLIRGALRQREFGIRAALGANKSQLVRDSLLESLLLSVIGVAIGTLLAWWTTGLIKGQAPADFITMTLDLRPDPNALGFAAIVALVTGLAAGCLPAIRAAKTDPLQLIRRQGKAGKASRFGLLYGSVVVQMALSTVLAVAAGLLLNGYLQASDLETRFDSTNVLAANFDLTPFGYDESRGRIFYDRLIRQIEALPGVERAALTADSPFGTAARIVRIEAPSTITGVRFTIVSPGYFEALRIEQMAGQIPTSSNGIVINESLARLLSIGQSALGSQLRLGSEADAQFEVVGIVKDLTVRGETQSAEPAIYRSFDREYRPAMTLVAKIANNPAGIMDLVRRSVASIDPDVAVLQMRTLEEEQNTRLSGSRRQLAALFTALGLIALSITGIGIYGVVGYTSRSRHHEFAIRAALGSGPKQIVWQVIRTAMSMSALGLMVGLPIAFVLISILRSSLFGVTVWQPSVIFVVPAAAIVTALIASARSAWIASRTDVAKLLRQD